ncbi:hypothetical protein [Bradyrhizobium sp. SZCCHNR1002]|nr:hypothetical protein [Bradyrhizobium sp. SZCCHNR1002]
MPAHWTGKEQIALLIYPAFTALDMVGPHYMFTNLMDATTHIVAKTMALVTSDTGLVQLLAEYAPEPPFQSGTPATASARTLKLMDDMFAGFLEDARVACESARRK